MQETHVLVELGQEVLLLFGGAGVVLTAFCVFLSNYVANRTIEGRKAELNQELERIKAELSKETETHKLKLKKLELLFNKELDAAGDFLKAYREIRPSYSDPDMDRDDVCSDVVHRLDKIETDLNSFVVKHGAVITTSAREQLYECILLASNYKFGMVEEGQLFDEAKNKAGELLEKLGTIEEQLIAALRT
jgi:hypothetical protein